MWPMAAMITFVSGGASRSTWERSIATSGLTVSPTGSEIEDMSIDMDIDHLRSWIGREEVAKDVITPVPVAALAATLDRDDPKPRLGDELPPLWHWLYFQPIVRQSELGPDGHPKRGGFLPPVPLPRRMWAGARFEFHRPLRVGESIVRKSTIADVSAKEGRTGPLIFVLVRHDIAGPAGF